MRAAKSMVMKFHGNVREFPNLVVSNLVVCNFYVEAHFCALLRPFALLCALLRLRSFAFACAHLRSLACFCVRPRLGRRRLGTAEKRQESSYELVRTDVVRKHALDQPSFRLDCRERC